MATINSTQDYDVIHTLKFNVSTGTCKISLYRGSSTAFTGTVYYRAGTSGTWNSLSVTSTTTTFPISSTTMQVGHSWNKSGNDYMTCSFYGETKLTEIAISQKAALSGTVGNYFMSYYAAGCSNLTSLDVPDTSSITTVGSAFMYSYAYNCTSLTSLNVPDTSSITTVGSSFMGYYAYNCTSLTSLILPAAGWFKTHDVRWSVPSGRLGYLKGYVIDGNDGDDWKALTAENKTLWHNYIRDEDDVIVPVVIPTVTTSACTDVTTTSAKGNGEITDTGGENCTERGFCYKTGTSGDPTTGDSKVYDTGSFGTGTFSKTISSLSSGTSYRVRAYAINSAGTGYGSTVSLLTKPAAPTNVSATDGTYTDKVVITWTKSTGATGYQVYRDGVALGWLGDVATYDDTGADAPSITPGSASASDGTSATHVALSLSGTSVSNGTTHTYKVRAKNATGESDDSTTNTGYRGYGTLTYQWQRSAADSDADYSDISGATTASYNDTGAPADGSGRYYKCVLNATGATQQISTADRGYRTILPTVTTSACTNTTTSQTQGNGEITATGGQNCTRRGFCYMKATSGDPTTENSVVYEDGSFGTGTFNKTISGLDSGSTYRVRAYAVNIAGTGYGNTVSVTTKNIFNETISDSATGKDSSSRNLTISVLLSDYGKARDSNSRNIIMSALLSDYAKGNDSSLRNLVMSALISDIAKTNDSDLSTLTANELLSDKAKGKDSSIINLIIDTLISDSAKAKDSDASALTASNLLSDTAKAIETLLAGFVVDDMLSDQTVGSDNLDVVAEYQRLITNIGIARDIISSLANLQASVNEQGIAKDAALSNEIVSRLLSSKAIASDFANLGAEIFEILTSNGIGSDSTSYERIIEAIIDSIAIGKDLISRIVNLQAQVKDTGIVKDNTSRSLTIDALISDLAKAKDNSLINLIIDALISDKAKGKDSNARNLIIDTLLSDKAKGKDSSFRNLTMSELVSDYAKASDNTLANAIIKMLLNDKSLGYDYANLGAEIFELLTSTGIGSDNQQTAGILGAIVRDLAILNDIVSSGMVYEAIISDRAIVADIIKLYFNILSRMIVLTSSKSRLKITLGHKVKQSVYIDHKSRLTVDLKGGE